MAPVSDLSFGEKAVGLTFNPSGDDKVAEIKKHFAAVIDILNDDRGDNRDERARLSSVAIIEAQGAQMWAVKAVTCEREQKETEKTVETPAEQPAFSPAPGSDQDMPVVVPAEQVTEQPQPQVVEVNGQDVQVNQDGNIVIDPTPETAPQPEQPVVQPQTITLN